MNLDNQIQQWVNIDDQIKLLNTKAKELREKRNVLEQNITNYAASNNLSLSSIPINGGKLKIVNTRLPEPLSYKYLENTLSEIIKNENQVKLIMEHIKQKRNIKTITEIKRY
jgi:hypothetical protein